MRTVTAFLLALLLMAGQEARAEPNVITPSCDRSVTDTTTVTAAEIGARFDCELERITKLESAQVSALLRAAQQGDKRAAAKLQRRFSAAE
jgi:hypothetical protein